MSRHTRQERRARRDLRDAVAEIGAELIEAARDGKTGRR